MLGIDDKKVRWGGLIFDKNVREIIKRRGRIAGYYESRRQRSTLNDEIKKLKDGAK